MLIDKPLCSFTECRKNFDHNCLASGGRREGCEFRLMEEAAMFAAESEENMKLVARARNVELDMLKKSETERYMTLLTSDPVVVAANAKRLEMSGAEVIIPLPQASMKMICSPETAKLLDKLQLEYTQRAENINRRYDELLEALEIPGVNVIETLQAAGVLNYSNTGLDMLPEVEPWSV